jgi:23S rRNA pseudouridine1911/1915/1917 synthase
VSQSVELYVEPADAGRRLDLFLAERLPEYSRTRIQAWIREGRALVDEVVARPSTVLRGGETVEVEPQALEPLAAEPEDIPLEILHEDEHLVAVNKPAGMTVHAGAGEASRSGTLVNGLLYRFAKLSSLGGELRPGIVHRLDRFTSGVIVVAKTDAAHRALAKAFEERRVKKTYWALVRGRVEDPSKRVLDPARLVSVDGLSWGRIETDIGRDRRHGRRMAVVEGGREAVTDYRPLAVAGGCSLIEVRIHTGRTHQIRVHLAALGRPIVGDRLYGGPAAPEGFPDSERFYLHARRLVVPHPASGATLAIEAPLGPDFRSALEELDGKK